MTIHRIPVVASMHRTSEWQSLPGSIVEVRLQGDHYRRGLVDDAMPDGSGLWLAADGANTREFIDKASGYNVWTSLYPASPHCCEQTDQIAFAATPQRPAPETPYWTHH